MSETLACSPYMLYIIDGTGPSNEAEYKLDMNRGFCYKLYQQIPSAKYWRGPEQMGTTTLKIANEALLEIQNAKTSNPKLILFLAGHSRGGAAVIYVAKELQKQNITVQGMFLFDAVDRISNSFVNLQTIPSTVKNCYHAMRDGALQNYYEYGATRARTQYSIYCTQQVQPSYLYGSTSINNPFSEKDCANFKDLMQQEYKMKTVMRNTTDLNITDHINFGNCGTEYESGCNFESAKFLGSHGALGGAPMATHPLKDVSNNAPRLMANSDMAAMACVDEWMSQRLAKEGIFTYGQTILKHKYN